MIKRVTVVLLVMLSEAGCINIGDDNAGIDDRSTFNSLPTVNLVHESDAIVIISSSMGIDSSDITSVRWVTSGLHRRDGDAVAGASIGCDLWISWLSDRWTSGAAADGPDISHTALSHEIAHCVLWIRGDSDPNHTKSEWWGPHGIVDAANIDLYDAGL